MPDCARYSQIGLPHPIAGLELSIGSYQQQPRLRRRVHCTYRVIAHDWDAHTREPIAAGFLKGRHGPEIGVVSSTEAVFESSRSIRVLDTGVRVGFSHQDSELLHELLHDLAVNRSAPLFRNGGSNSLSAAQCRQIARFATGVLQQVTDASRCGTN